MSFNKIITDSKTKVFILGGMVYKDFKALNILD